MSKKTNYNDLVKRVQTKLGEDTSVQEAKVAIAAVISSIPEVIVDSDNQRLGLQGFGSFNLSENKARKGYNPISDEEIMLEAHNRITFRSSKNLKDYINGRVNEFDFTLGLKKDPRTGKVEGAHVDPDASLKIDEKDVESARQSLEQDKPKVIRRRRRIF